MAFFNDKIVVVTGGSDGIGKALVDALLLKGAKVATCARNLDKLYQLEKSHVGKPLITFSADVSNEAECKNFINTVVKAYGGIDILINNAGESSQREVNGVNWPVNAVDAVSQPLPKGRFESITDEEWRGALEQKLLGMIRVTRSALPLMRRAGGGSIVNVTSIKGRQPPPRLVTSGVAWAAAMNLSKGLSLELASDNIRVNVVSVGGIMTGQMEAGRRKWAPEKSLEAFLAPRVANIPLQRLGTVEEVAQAIYFLASPLSSYVTGQLLAVDGGGLRSI